MPVNLEFGQKTGSAFSCSALLNGKMLILGGYDNRGRTDQITEVKDCSLERIGTFPEPVRDPACNTFAMPGESVWICFTQESRSSCRRLDGQNRSVMSWIFTLAWTNRSWSTNQMPNSVIGWPPWASTTKRPLLLETPFLAMLRSSTFKRPGQLLTIFLSFLAQFSNIRQSHCRTSCFSLVRLTILKIIFSMIPFRWWRRWICAGYSCQI